MSGALRMIADEPIEKLAVMKQTHSVLTHVRKKSAANFVWFIPFV